MKEKSLNDDQMHDTFGFTILSSSEQKYSCEQNGNRVFLVCHGTQTTTIKLCIPGCEVAFDGPVIVPLYPPTRKFHISFYSIPY